MYIYNIDISIYFYQQQPLDMAPTSVTQHGLGLGRLKNTTRVYPHNKGPLSLVAECFHQSSSIFGIPSGILTVGV